MKLPQWTVAAGLALAIAGCAVLTAPKPLIDEFAWELVDNPDDVTEGVSMAGFFGDISFLGQAKTPTRCYGVSAEVEVEDAVITMRVEMTTTDSGTCAQSAGGVRYTGIVRNLTRGPYTVHVIHTVKSVGVQEFTQEITL